MAKVIQVKKVTKYENDLMHHVDLTLKKTIVSKAKENLTLNEADDTSKAFSIPFCSVCKSVP